MSFFARLIGTSLPTIDVATANERPPRVLLVDVREPSEWADGHAPGALHRPLGGLDPTTLPKADRYFVICRSGNRSARATEALVAAGLDAYNVEGGMSAWARAGLPIVQD
jgi:rhodanese-related sulfurtransferase